MKQKQPNHSPRDPLRAVLPSGPCKSENEIDIRDDPNKEDHTQNMSCSGALPSIADRESAYYPLGITHSEEHRVCILELCLVRFGCVQTVMKVYNFEAKTTN
ncbi:hypothetical protein AVEN_39098-1 [Araneus ventricosus]|uniref:Uncharacterized protein n=1 Tax=Araneus ventricosus TaxID=182803 RepID=A0A4Y2DH54_ARAVE|nr:hypothetical protein AVEN_39098-1 [Araneus ventricosus]